MKSISKLRLPIEIYTFQEIISTENFRAVNVDWQEEAAFW
jgi:hypothetical protein